ncbi:arabinosyltransferase domain-containing protein [Blastococcus saxobsidens]|uniref:Arabinosyltransferase C n=1 Tax=Blastococcus saxobsidens TaxID=138336 RepID=A0A4Q7Y7S6_9ACTN|nr:arabinosyltransferase domain-containing protein [Blastococcus saxobsidens]RZU33092.1 arabinosyltransferase C [Blastococcus saxobsidens]
MSTTLVPEAVDDGTPAAARRRPRAGTRWLAPSLGLLGVVLAVALPFAPVVVDRTEVSWPQQGAQPTSTTAFFVPYRPAELHAEVPCAAVQAAAAQADRTTLLATTVVRDGGQAAGLVIDTADGRLRVLVNGRLVSEAPVPATGCDVRVDSDDVATTLAVGSAPPTVLPGEPVPEVFAFATDLPPGDAAGTSVTARTRTWFESRPSDAKLAMIGGYVVLLAVSLALLARQDVRRVPAPARERGARSPGRALRAGLDAVVVLVLAGWAVIAPQTDDDGYASMTIRNGLESGDIGNYYHWFNASEAPFTLVQHLVQPLAAVTTAPLWLRLPSLVAGLVAWFVLSRGVLGAALPAHARRPLVRGFAALCFLAWWLPFNIGVRPEPFVALGSATVLALLLRGTAPGARRPLLLLGGAALAAGLTMSVTPSAVVALAPVLVLFPRIWGLLRAGGTPSARASWVTTVGRTALVAAAAASGLVVMFADQSWDGVAKATELHTLIGPNLHWYEELTRYGYLMSIGAQGTATKRLPVLLTLVLVVVVALLLARRVPALHGLGRPQAVTGAAALAFALLIVTPSKWSHHFGAVAGLGTAFLVVAGVLLVRVARARSGDSALVLVSALGTGLVALVAGLSFSGANSWWLYSNYGLAYRDVAVRPLGIPIDNPVTWLLVAGAVAGVAWLLARRGAGDPRAAVVAGPALLAGAAMLASVTVLLATFTAAPLRQADGGGYSLAAENVATLTGAADCGIADHIEVLRDAPGGQLPPAAEVSPDAGSTGFALGGGYPSPPPPTSGGAAPAAAWGSLLGGELGTGSLVSPWATLPAVSGLGDVAVDAVGRVNGANRLELEFGRSGTGGVVTPLARVLLGEDGVATPEWRTFAVGSDRIPADADRVRVLATDSATDAGGWLGVTGPRARTAQPMTEFLADRGPVLPDWPLSWQVPCVRDIPVLSDGLAQAPEVLLQAPPAYADLAGIAYEPSQGGSFAGASLARREVLATRLVGPGSEEWGSLAVLDYPVTRDAYDRATQRTTLWGWEGDR